ncbi:ABC transporter substrate-binding protein [Methylophaga lonarensis]|uniref:ABC transporter substrate-binding protein n=1 Tax=Methylophaga lonarensis TaxID=999151 RepID=UPI003D29A9AB
MRRYWPLSVFIAIFVYLVIVANSQPTGRDEVNAQDDAEVERIISLAPSITETLYSIGLADQLIAVTDFCNTPTNTPPKPTIGAYLDPNLEAIVAMQPDLVILLDRQQRVVQQLQQLGIRTLPVNHASLDGILTSMHDIAVNTGAVEQVSKLLASLQTRIDHVQAMTADQEMPSVLLAIAHAGASEQQFGQIYVAGQHDFYNDLLKLAGAQNSYQDRRVSVPSVSTEGILRLNPDIIIDLYPASGQHPFNLDIMQAHWQKLSQVNAIRNDQLHLIEASYAVIPGPGVVDLLEHIARLIHPQLQWTADAD